MKRIICLILMCFFLFGNSIQCFCQENESSALLSETINSIFIEENETITFDEKFLSNAGTTASDWYVIALKNAGFEAEYSKYLDALSAYIMQKYETENKLHPVKATEWHRISLAMMSCGGDPTNVNGINLIDDGIFNRNLDKQGLNAYIWALVCLGADDFTQPSGAINTEESIISELIDAQLDDGGFSLSGTMGDPDVTAMVVTALSNFYISDYPNVVECIDKSITYLSSVQNDDGGYSSYGVPNCESACQVVIALSSVGIDGSSDERFIKNGNSVYENIYTFKTADGFKHIADGETNYLATQQAILAISAYSSLGNGSIYNQSTSNDNEKVDENLLSNNDIELMKKLSKKVNASDLMTLKRLSQTLENYSGDDKFVLETSVNLAISNAEKIISNIENIENKISELSDMSFKFLHKKDLNEINSSYNSLSEIDKTLVENYYMFLQIQAEINTQIRQLIITILIFIAVLICTIYLMRKRRKNKDN